MRAVLIVALIIVAAVAAYTYVQRSSAPSTSSGADAVAPQGAENAQAAYWEAPLPSGYVEVKDVQPEFEVSVTPAHVGPRNVLKVTVREKHGLLVDAIQFKFTHLLKDQTSDEMVPDPKSRPLIYLARKRLEAGGVLEDDTTLNGLEMEELSDGNIGTPENWKAEVVSWARLARKPG
ncbi:MAG TPA: hypothetical protein VGM03_11320 [Phycisphaerae bacterium]